jgi:hypothetical protein
MDTPPKSNINLVEGKKNGMRCVKGFVESRPVFEVNRELSIGKKLSLLGMGEPGLNRDGLRTSCGTGKVKQLLTLKMDARVEC